MELPEYRLDTDETLAFEHRELAGILDYWQRKRGARTLPARADLDPLEMHEHLGWIILADVIGLPARFRYRLIGTEVTRRVGRDSTGLHLEDVYPAEHYDAVVAPFRWVVENRRPLRAMGRLWFADRDWHSFEAVHLPLGRDGTTVDMILVRTVIS